MKSQLKASGDRLKDMRERKQDVLFDKELIFIRGGKGKRDRTVTLSESVSIVLKRYMEIYKPNYWMFEGMNRKQ